MNKLDCQKLTEILLHLSQEDTVLGDLDPDMIVQKKEEIDQYVEELHERYKPSVFVQELLRQPEFWVKFKDILSDLKYKRLLKDGQLNCEVLKHKVMDEKLTRLYAQFYAEFAESFSKKVTLFKKFDEQDIREIISSERSTDVFMNFFRNGKILEHSDLPVLLTMIVSMLTERSALQGQAAEISCENSSVDHGLFLRKGALSLDFPGKAATCLNGGEVEIKNMSAGSVATNMLAGRVTFWGNIDHHISLGKGMTGGEIVVRGSVNCLSYHFGGTIKADNVEEIKEDCRATLMAGRVASETSIATTAFIQFLQYRSITIDLNRAVVLIGEYFDQGMTPLIWLNKGSGNSGIGSKKPDAKVYQYFEQEDQRGMYRNYVGQEPRRVRHRLQLAGNWRKNMIIIENYKKLGFNIFDKMKSGIIVFEELPDIIGSGMEGGICIIEVPGMSPEEVKARISPKKKAGFILLRVPDPENEGKTKLVDVEEV